MADNIIIRIIGEDKFSPVALSVSRKLQNLGKDITQVGKTMSMFITAPILAAGTASVMAASNLEESMNKTRVVFGEAAGAIVDFAATAATELGMTQQQALEASGTFGNLFTSMGLGLPVAADMSKGLVQLASDLASFNNISPEVALEKLRAGLVGEVEPLRTLGVNLSADAVYAKALAMGLAETKDALTPAMLAQARYALILEQTTNAQGDFARTSEGTANSLRIARAQLGDAAAAIGVQLLPALTQLLNLITPLIAQFAALNPETQKTIVIILGVVAAIGPLLIVVGQLITAWGALVPLISAAGPVFTAIAGLLTGPVILAIAAVVAAVALLAVAWKNNWGDIQGKTAAATAWIKEAFNKWLASLMNVYQLFSLAFQGRWYEFGQKLREMWDGAWENIKNGLVAAWNFISTAVSQGIANIIKWFRETDWGAVGTAIVRGIANGITAGASFIVNAAKAAAQAALDAAKGFLGIKSPSTVFAGVGKQMMQGMAVGISGNAKLPAMASVAAAQTVTQAASDNRTYNFHYSGNASPQQIFQSYEMAKLLG